MMTASERQKAYRLRQAQKLLDGAQLNAIIAKRDAALNAIVKKLDGNDKPLAIALRKIAEDGLAGISQRGEE